ncbi:hypothetical protein [Streptomyces sp. b94]|uniref:hypothetical protein n=1 Tax=Streptomyces sp. b94 TaxID=1827634 RepID=UPI001FFC6180|nr:hypothetical protein [Streptomyces sp. b94]
MRTHLADVAWTVLCVVLALCAVWSAVDLARDATAWTYCAVARVLLAVALTLRVVAVRRGTSL